MLFKCGDVCNALNYHIASQENVGDRCSVMRWMFLFQLAHQDVH